MLRELSPEMMDALKEIGNIGIGNAATALSKMTSKQVDITFPDVELKDFEDIFCTNSDDVSVSVLEIIGDLTGKIIFMCPQTDHKTLVECILGSHCPPDQFQELEISAFKETANILCTNYLNSLAQFFNITLLAEPPSFVAGKVCDVAQELKRGFKDATDSSVLSVNTDLRLEGGKMRSLIYLTLNNDSFTVLLNTISDQMGVA